MAWPTIIIGILLQAIGIYSYLNGTPNAETGAVSKTALIPAGFGLVLLILGVLSFQDHLRKHVMHFAAMVGLFGIFGGFMPVMRAKEFDLSKPSIQAGLGMTVLCLIFVVLCVKSFIDARKAREAKARSGAA